MTRLLKKLSRYDSDELVCGIGYAHASPSRSLESFGLGTLFPENLNCGTFMVSLLRSTSTQKTFASYLFCHLQPEISPKCPLASCVTRTKLLHLLVPLLYATFIVPLIWSSQILDIALGLKNLHDFDIIHGDIRAVRPNLEFKCHFSQPFILF